MTTKNIYGYVRSRDKKVDHIVDCPYYTKIKGYLNQHNAVQNLYYDGYVTMTENRDGLMNVLKKLEEGDTLVSVSLDRLVKGMNEAFLLLRALMDKNVDLVLLESDIKLLNKHNIDTIKLSEFFELLYKTQKEWDRDKSIVERIQYNIICKRGSRPTRMSKIKLRAIQKEIREGTPIKVIQKMFNLTSATIYKYMSPEGELRPAGISLANSDFILRV